MGWCRMVAWSCALTGNLNPVVLLGESGLESHVFLHLFFLLSMYFRIFLEKRIEQLLHQSLEPTLSVSTVALILISSLRPIDDPAILNHCLQFGT